MDSKRSETKHSPRLRGNRHGTANRLLSVNNHSECIKHQRVIHALSAMYHIYIPVRGFEVWLHHDNYIYIYIYIYIYVTCHAKTRPSAHFIILRKTITNTEHERSIEFEFFIYHESTMTYLRGSTFEIFI